MTVAIFAEDVPVGDVLKTLLARAGIDAVAYTTRHDEPGLVDQLTALRDQFTDLVWVGAAARALPVRSVALAPSLAAWLTRDADANEQVLGTREVPSADDADGWLRARNLAGDRRYSITVDGCALARHLDLGLLAACSPEFRELITTLRPAWATDQPIKRGRGRPPGVSLFRGTGYALCLELLHLGDAAALTAATLTATLHRTKTPILRLLTECQQRGYLRRTSARGPLTVRDTTRLLDDLVTSVRAERLAHPPSVLHLRSDRDRDGLAARVGAELATHGRVLAVTGATAVLDLGGDMLVGGPTYAYANLAGLDAPPADAYRDARNPSLILIEPREEGVFHRLRVGEPSRVSTWQAVIDLLASDSERERGVGREIRHRLEESR